jgi:carboxymethylenebutenolidase
VTETTIEVMTSRGVMPVHLSAPDGEGPFPLVVLFMDAPGVRPALHEHAHRLTAHGYRTALPDLYYALASDQRPAPERLSAGDGTEFARMDAAVSTLRHDEVLADARDMLAQLQAGHTPWACVGFCAGGRFGLRAAQRFGSGVAAAALLHPSRLVTDEPDAPYRQLDAVAATLYLGFGENDHVTPLSSIAPLRDALDEHEVDYRIEVIPGADHGFTMPGLPAYNEAAAQRAWSATLALLDERLADRA